MKFNQFLLVLLVGISSNMVQFATYDNQQKIALQCANGKDYILRACDLEAYIKKTYDCSLNIRINEPEIINAIGDILVLYNPQLVDGNRLQCMISRSAWNKLGDKAKKIDQQTIAKREQYLKRAEWMKMGLIALLTGGTIALCKGYNIAGFALRDDLSSMGKGIFFALLGVIEPAVFISWMNSIEPYVYPYPQPKKTVLGWEKVSEDKTTQTVCIQTTYSVCYIPYIKGS